MVGTGQDVLDAELRIAPEHVDPPGAHGDREPRLAGTQHALHDTTVGEHDAHERVGLAGREAVHAHLPADEPAWAVRGPARGDAVRGRRVRRRRLGDAIGGQHRLEGRAGRLEHGDLPGDGDPLTCELLDLEERGRERMRRRTSAEGAEREHGRHQGCAECSHPRPFPGGSTRTTYFARRSRSAAARRASRRFSRTSARTRDLTASSGGVCIDSFSSTFTRCRP